MKADPRESLAQKFAGNAFGKVLKCEFRPRQPYLNFGLVYETGYILRFPRGEFGGRGGSVEVVLRQTPLQGGKPAGYLSNLLMIPATLGAKEYMEVSARFAADPGSYKVEAVVTDSNGGVCRGEWRLEVPEITFTPRSSVGHPPARLTVFLNAAPLNFLGTSLQPNDVAMLAGSILTVTKSFPGVPMRIVIISLNSGKEFARYNSFGRADLGRLIDILRSIQTGTIDYASLKAHAGPARFLQELVERETSERERSDIVVFLGPVSRSSENVPKRDTFKLAASASAYYYLEYKQPVGLTDWGAPPAVSVPPSSTRTNSNQGEYPVATLRPGTGPRIVPPDTIQHLMQRVSGRTLVFSTPEEFESALSRIAARGVA